MTKKQLIEFAKFEIHRSRNAAAAGSIMADYHQMESDVLSELLKTYIKLNTLEREAVKQTGLNLSELFDLNQEDAEQEPELLPGEKFEVKF